MTTTREYLDRKPLTREEMAAAVARDIPAGSIVNLGIGLPTSVAGHLDVSVMGAFQVSSTGDLANWSTGAPDAVPAVGGAMDLAIGAKAVYIMMSLFAKDGTPKLVPQCTYPLTGKRCVSRIYTDLAIIGIDHEQGATVYETFGISLADLARRLDVPLLTRASVTV